MSMEEARREKNGETQEEKKVRNDGTGMQVSQSTLELHRNLRPKHTFYQIHKKIGSGSFGEVFLALCLRTQKWVAVKKSPFTENGLSQDVLREASNLHLCRHAHVVAFLDAFVDAGRGKVALVLEYCDATLKEFMCRYDEKLIPRSLVKLFMNQLFVAVAHCHGLGVMHRDIKPQNILVCEKGPSLKLSDFGLSRRKSCAAAVPMTPDVVTIWYRAPELLVGADYTHSVDDWSVGCVLYETTTGNPLFPGSSEVEMLHLVCRCKPLFFASFASVMSCWGPVARCVLSPRHACTYVYTNLSVPHVGVLSRKLVWSCRSRLGPLPKKLMTDCATVEIKTGEDWGDDEFSKHPRFEGGDVVILRGLLQMDDTKRMTCRDALVHESWV